MVPISPNDCVFDRPLTKPSRSIKYPRLPLVDLRDGCVIVDGSNFLYGRNNQPSLANLLSVVVPLARECRDTIVVFDASVRKVLWEAGRSFDIRTYNCLLARHRESTLETVAGSSGDPVILAEADRCSGFVASNDKFRGFASLFPWMRDRDRFVRVNWFRNHLHFNGHLYPIRHNVNRLMDELETLL